MEYVTTYLEKKLLRLHVLAPQLLTEGLEVIGDEQLVVESGDAGVSLGEHHLKHVEGDPEEGPLVVHLLEQLEVLDVLVHGALEGGANAEPHGEVEPGLGPGEDPGDGTQRCDAATGPSLGRTTTDVHAAVLSLRCSLLITYMTCMERAKMNL
jgi:hypothetical protein